MRVIPQFFGDTRVPKAEGVLENVVLAMLAFCLLALSGARAQADYTVIEVNFILANKNGPSDQQARISARGHRAVSGSWIRTRITSLSRASLGIAKDSEFLDGDADKNGSLSVEEVIAEKLADFDAADTNKDGTLNVDEVPPMTRSKEEAMTVTSYSRLVTFMACSFMAFTAIVARPASATRSRSSDRNKKRKSNYKKK